MTLSDEDLDYWKKRCGHLNPFSGLIARLEAAEKKAQYAGHSYHCDKATRHNGVCECGLDVVDYAWLRAKGIDPGSLQEWNRKAAGK